MKEKKKRRDKTHKLTGTPADERLERGMKRKEKNDTTSVVEEETTTDNIQK